MSQPTVPSALRKWFVVHFVADMLFAIPMLIAPVPFLALFGWQVTDPIATRVVAAALFGIGIQSLLGRNESLETFRAMLNLKIIWSSSAALGIALSAFQLGERAPFGAWLLAGVFAGFLVLWSTYRRRLNG